MASRPASLKAAQFSNRFERIHFGNLVEYARSVLHDVPRTRADFPITVSVRLPDLEVVVHLQNSTLAEAISRNLVQTRVVPVTDRSRSIEIFIAHPEIGVIRPPAPWCNDPYRPHEIATLLAQSGLHASYFHDLDHWQFFDPEAGLGVELMRSPDDYPPWEPSAPLRPFLHWHYARQGMRLAHCGTLGLNGVGVLLAGAGGAGKSGTVVAGLVNGLQSVGDDYILLDVGTEIVGYPIFASLKQDQAGFHRLGLKDRLANPGPLNWQGKYEFRIGQICDGSPPDRLSIKALFVASVTGDAHTKIEPISRRDAMLALAPSSIHQMPGERESGFVFFSQIANSLPCYVIKLGTDPTGVAKTIAEFLEKAAR